MATIITKFSSTASAVPTSSDLVQGELAVNTADKRLFTEDSGATIIELGTNPTSVTTGAITASGNVTVGGNLSVTGNATISGNLTFGDADTDSIALNADVNSNILPNTDDTYDLGSATKEWRNLYIDGTANIDSLVADTADINGGTVDGAIIGGSSAAAGTFTTTTATTGNITTLNSTTVDTTSLEVTNLKAKDGTSAGSIADSTGVVTIASSVLTTTDINGGSIDGAVLGGSSAAAITGTSITGTSFVSSGNMTFGDNDKAIFGAGSDLQIYHNGSHSIIADAGTGHLKLLAADLRINNAADTETFIAAYENSKVDIYYDNSVKLTTTSTGIDVTGTATMDGLTVDGDASVITLNNTDTSLSLGQTLGEIKFNQNDPSDQGVGTVASIEVENRGAIAGYGQFNFKTGSATSLLDRLSITEGGDISFYEDTGTTAKFFWDASAESLGIGTTSPARSIHVAQSVPSLRLEDTDVASLYGEIVQLSTGDLSFRADQGNVQASTSISFSTDGTEKVRIDSSGNVGIGTSSPDEKLEIEDGNIKITNTVSNESRIYFTHTTTANRRAYIGALETDGNGSSLIFAPNPNGFDGTEAMRIDSSGNLLVGKTTADSGATAGIETNNNGRINATRDGSIAGVFNRLTSDGDIVQFRKDGTTVGSISSVATGKIGFYGSGGTGAVIDSSGNVGIGTDSPSNKIHAYVSSGSIQTLLKLENASTTAASGTKISFTEGGTERAAIISQINSGTTPYLSFTNNGSERMRIDSSGNLLVGKTAVALGVVGVEVKPNGEVRATTDGSFGLQLNRLTSDGTLVDFRKDGTTVGSIGSASGAYLTVGNNTSGLMFVDAGSPHSIRPHNVSTNLPSDDNLDFGASSARFQDIYATNGTVQTSDRNEKQDIESLSEAEQRVAVAAKALLRKFRWKSAVEEKGDDARIHFGIIAQDLQAAFEAEGLDAGRYAMFIHSTWTDEETGEERSRMGVRYSELLAFIIAAI